MVYDLSRMTTRARQALMHKVAFIARIGAALVSFLYMLILLPHIEGIEAHHFSSIWFLGAWIVALVWIPLLLLQRRLDQLEEPVIIGLSVAPLFLFAIFFGMLFLSA